MKLLSLGFFFFVYTAFATERGFDRVTPVSRADIVCGKVNKKFVIISTELKRVWYVSGEDPVTYKKLKSISHTSELEGSKAFEYEVSHNSGYKFPTKNGTGSFVASYKCDLASCRNGTFLSIREGSGQYRIFQGENGANGLCKHI